MIVKLNTFLGIYGKNIIFKQISAADSCALLGVTKHARLVGGLRT